MVAVKGEKKKTAQDKKADISKEEKVIRYSFLVLGIIIAISAFYFLITALIPKNYVKVGNKRIEEKEFLYHTNLQYNIFMNNNMDNIAALGFDISSQDGVMSFLKSAYDNNRSFGQLLLDQVVSGIQENFIIHELIKETGFKIDEEELNENYNIQMQSLKRLADEEGFTLEQFATQYYGSNLKTMQKVIKDSLTAQQYIVHLEEEYLDNVTEDRARAYYESEDSQGYKTRDEIDRITVVNVIKRTLGDDLKPLADDVIEAAKREAEKVYQLALEGKDIYELAKEYSDEFAEDEDLDVDDVLVKEDTIDEDDEDQEERPGEISFSKSEIRIAEISDWAFNAKIGDVELIKTDLGYFVIKIVDRTDFDDVKDRVFNLIASSDYELKMAEYKKMPKYAVALYRPFQEMYQGYTTTH